MSMPLNTGDMRDDDAEVLDSLVQQQANPLPVPVQEMTRPVSDIPKRTTRLISGTIWLGASWEPLQLLPQDYSRSDLIIRVVSPTPTDFIYVADDKGKLRSDLTAYTLFPGEPLILRHHTGPVCVMSGGMICGVSYIATTC